MDAVTSGFVTARGRGSGQLTTWIRDEISHQITRGTFRPGQQLPTERELSDSFGVSRVTVRRALALLADEGLVNAVQGRGTFVASEPLAEPPNALLSFHDMVANENVAVGAEPLRVEIRPATLAEAELFRIAPGSELFQLERLRTLDKLPVAIDFNLLPAALAPGLADLDWVEESLYSRLSAAGHAPVLADYVVEARAADERAAELLAAAVGSPLLVAESHAFDKSQRLIVAGLIQYRGDRYRFRSTLTARQHSATRPARRPGQGIDLDGVGAVGPAEVPREPV